MQVSCPGIIPQPLPHLQDGVQWGIGERLNEMTSPLYGADAHIDKPFDFKELEAMMAKLLAGEAAS